MATVKKKNKIKFLKNKQMLICKGNAKKNNIMKS